MTISDYISISALIVSIVSLMISWYFGFRDKAHIKTFAKFYPYRPDHDRARIEIKIVNSGRRPVILTMFGGDFKDKGWCGAYIGKEKKGIRLEEHEKYETTVYSEDLVCISPEEEYSEYINFWFENTLGQRYKVNNSEELIKKLRKDSGT